MVSSVITFSSELNCKLGAWAWTFKPTVRWCDLIVYYCNNNQSTEVMTYSK